MKTQWFRVTGRVQGVGFRAFVQRTGVEMGLSGEVWNTFGGAVEMEIRGDEKVLGEFESAMSRGPGRVDMVVSQILVDQDLGGVVKIGPTRRDSV